jgi:DNA-binding GntR family transcriptional regulator
MIQRHTLRRQIRAILRDRIVEGLIPAATPISEPQLAANLGVSRTPLREALIQLEREGLVSSDAGKGFSVGPLSATEVHEIYPILATLHGLALRLAGAPPTTQLDALKRLNEDIRASRGNARRLFKLDRQWHADLLAACPNRRLLTMIEEFNGLARRYDIAYWKDAGDVIVSYEQHAGILTALRRGRVRTAARLLEQHWMWGVDPVVCWLEARRAADAVA